MIDQILPATVFAAERFGYATGVVLFPKEQSVVAHAGASRKLEFATARACARAALASLSFPAVPIVPGPGGTPQWPPGVVGSITHTAGYSASAVARARDVLTVGIDAEPHVVLPGGVLEMVAVAEELAGIADLAATRPEICWDRVLFSAKESVYKAWFPLTRNWLGFEDAVITIDPVVMAFAVRLLVPRLAVPCPADFSGRFLICGDLVLTSVTVPT